MTAGACPLPPADFGRRRVPVKELDLTAAPLLRVYRSVYDPIFFNRRSSSATVFRFDAPATNTAFCTQRRSCPPACSRP